MRYSTLLYTLSALAGCATAAPTSEDNDIWETVVNGLGKEELVFKPGMGPGSEANARVIGISNETEHARNSLQMRQDDRFSEPIMGSTQIEVGCDFDISFLMHKLYDLCHENYCDEGREITLDSSYPNRGIQEGAKVNAYDIRGSWWRDWEMRDKLVESMKAMVTDDAIEKEWKQSYAQAGGPYGHDNARSFSCDIVKVSNWYRFEIWNNEWDNGPAAYISAMVRFERDSDLWTCGIAGSATGTVLGPLNGINGGVFGFIRDIASR